MKIKEVIVVEGRHDTSMLQQYFDCDTIETNGLSLSEETHASDRRSERSLWGHHLHGSRSPRRNDPPAHHEAVKGCKNAYIAKNKAKTPRKVGVEHARRKDLEEALQHCFTYTETPAVTMTMEDMLELGLQGRADSARRREWLGMCYHLGKPNAKTLLKRLNLLQVDAQEVRAQLAKGGFA